MTKEKLFEIIEDEDWMITDDGEQVLLSKYSPAGEDFGFYVEKDTPDMMIDEITYYYQTFDPEEHAEIWFPIRGQNGVPNSIRAILDDADEINEMLKDLAKKLKEVA